MKVICQKSGLAFTVPQFRSTIYNACHPVFSLGQAQLFSQLKEFVRGNLSEEEQILLFLALADSSGKIIWRNPFKLTDDAVSIIAVNLTPLAATISRIQEIRHPRFSVPQYVCSSHGSANTVRGFLNMLAVWDQAIADWVTGEAAAAKAANLLRMEEGLERIVRLAKQKPQVYAKTIAKWAAEAGEFPDGVTLVGSQLIPLREYWQSLIRACVLKEGLQRIPMDDVLELLEHCELTIPHGTLHAAALMESLREGVRMQREFLGLPSVSGIKMFSIVGASTEEKAEYEKEKALLASMSASAPLAMPTREQFSDTFLYMRAMARWRASQTMAAQAQEEEKISAKKSLAEEIKEAAAELDQEEVSEEILEDDADDLDAEYIPEFGETVDGSEAL